MQLHVQAKTNPTDGGCVADAGSEQQGSPSKSCAAVEGDIREDDPLFLSDEFRMYCYKVLPCAKRFCHDWSTCPFAHFSERAKRRDPRAVKYTAIACPEMKKGEDCPRGDKCPYAHNVFEYWLHPTRYRTRMCRDGTSCTRKVCFFAHKAEDLRVPPCRPSLPVADDAWTFGSDDPDDADGTVFGIADSGRSALHRRTVSVPQEFLAGRSGHVDPFQIDIPPPRAYSISENPAAGPQSARSAGDLSSAALMETLLNSVSHQQPVPNLNGNVSAAESVARALLANLSLSDVGKVQGNSQPLQYHSQPLATLLAGSSPGILPIGGAGVSCGLPSLPIGFPCFANGQVVDLGHGLPVTGQSPAMLQNMTHALVGLPHGIGSNGHGEALAIGGGDEKGDLMRALLALQSQQQCDMSLSGSIGVAGITGTDSSLFPTSMPHMQLDGLKGVDAGYPFNGSGVLKGVSGLL